MWTIVKGEIVAQLPYGGGQVGQVTIKVGFLVGQLLSRRLLQVASIIP